MPAVIKAENLSKAYQLGEIGTGTISRDLERAWARMRGKEDPFLKIGEVNDRSVKGQSDIVWSLNDLNFEIEQGDAVGIIGRNGAGKSTLLKILSRVTAPTRGSVKIKGRVASLLEVGTGFHPELTGRENIYLNGAILGMRKAEIKRKFDEIVDFSGVERYVDTPVKRYSSGMYVRLAFGVAAHLESEILIVDEVLAVGDAEFQKKCLGKMGDVSKGEGRTVLFVSHNMGSINQFCSKAILLTHGKITSYDKTSFVINQYLNQNTNFDSNVDLALLTNLKRTGNKKVQFQNVSLRRQNSETFSREYSIGENVELTFTIKVINPNDRKVKVAVLIKTTEGLNLSNIVDADSNFQAICPDQGIYEFKVLFEDMRLYTGSYLMNLYAGDISSLETYDYVEDAIGFDILDGGKYTQRQLDWNAGYFFMTPQWKQIS